MIPLLRRRAIFVYEAARFAAIAANAPVIPAHWDSREEEFQIQFLDVIERQCNIMTRSMSAADLHGTWIEAYDKMGWVYGKTYDPELKLHPDMVPYFELGQLEQDKDQVFVELCEIARQWIYD